MIYYRETVNHSLFNIAVRCVILDIFGLDKIIKISDNTDLEINVTGLDMIRPEDDSVSVTGLEFIKQIETDAGLDDIRTGSSGVATDFPKLSPFAMELIRLISRARELDVGLKYYGSQVHRYELAPVLPVSQVRDFEQRHNIRLPQVYFEFLTQVGNGGAGPDFGLYSLEQLEFRNFCTHSDRGVPYALAQAEEDYYTFSYTAGSPMMLDSTLTKEKWDKLCAEIEKHREDGDRIAYEAKRRQLYNGVLQIVDTDNSFCPVLICRGDMYGEVSDFSHDLDMPRYSRKSFEDWITGYFEGIVRSF